MSTALAAIQGILDGNRPNLSDAAALIAEGDLISPALAANKIQAQLLGDDTGTVTFIEDRTILLRPAADEDEIRELVLQAARTESCRQLIIQSSQPNFPSLGFFTDLLTEIRRHRPTLEIIGASPSEVLVWAEAGRRSTADILAELQSAGLKALLAAAGDARAADPHQYTAVQHEYRKLLLEAWPQWDDTIRAAGAAGVAVIAPVPFGVGETPAQRAALLHRLERLQAETDIIRAMAPITPAAPAPAANTPPQVGGTGYEYLRMIALCRLLAPNIRHVAASPLTQGAKVAQVALGCGANDLGGTQRQFKEAELAAGRTGPMTSAEFTRLITDAGLTPAQRSADFVRLPAAQTAGR